MFEYMFTYKNCNIVFAHENEDDLMLVKDLQKKLGVCVSTELKDSINKKHIYFRLLFVGERLDRGIEENTKEQGQKRGSTCLAFHTLYISSEASLQSSKDILPSRLVVSYQSSKTYVKSLPQTSIDEIVSHVDGAIKKLEIKSHAPDVIPEQDNKISYLQTACQAYFDHLTKQMDTTDSISDFNLASKKKEIVTNALNALKVPDYNQCVGILMKGKDILSQRRDSGFMTFAKACAVIGVMFVTLGIGTYFAYRGLFVTRGEKLLESAEANVLNAKPSI